MPNINAFIPERLVEAREARALTMTQLADIVGVSTAAISQYEHGLHAPRPDTVERLASSLHLPEHFFYRPLDNLKTTTIYFRKLSSVTKRDRVRTMRRIGWLVNLARFLEEYIEFMPVRAPDMSIGANPAATSLDEVEEIAGKVRSFYGLGNGPISNVTQLLENHGFLISREEFEADGMDATSTVASDGRPYIILNPEMAARQRFNLAHELGHIVMHRQVRIDTLNLKLVEEQAHRFASAFLLPAKSYLTEFSIPSLAVFKSLKRRWGVSIAAQVQRCQDLGLISENRVTLFWKKIGREGWRRKEPYDDELAALESPRFLAESIRLLVESGTMSKDQIRNAVGLSGADIGSLACLEDNFFGCSSGEAPQYPKLKELKIIDIKSFKK